MANEQLVSGGGEEALLLLPLLLREEDARELRYLLHAAVAATAATVVGRGCSGGEQLRGRRQRGRRCGARRRRRLHIVGVLDEKFGRQRRFCGRRRKRSDAFELHVHMRQRQWRRRRCGRSGGGERQRKFSAICDWSTPPCRALVSSPLTVATAYKRAS